MRLEGQVGDQSGIHHRLIMTDYEVDNHRQSVIISHNDQHFVDEVFQVLSRFDHQIHQ